MNQGKLFYLNTGGREGTNKKKKRVNKICPFFSSNLLSQERAT